jgi:hypothetical protein
VGSEMCIRDSIPFRYNDVVKGKLLEQNIIMKRGDVIVVP